MRVADQERPHQLDQHVEHLLSLHQPLVEIDPLHVRVVQVVVVEVALTHN